MLSFSGGPAEGATMIARRAPLLLRVVYCARKDEFDVLDQLSDTPAEHESIYVYRRTSSADPCFLDYSDRGGRRRGMRCMIAQYQFLEPQPGDTNTRINDAWQRWCEAYVAKNLTPAGVGSNEREGPR